MLLLDVQNLTTEVKLAGRWLPVVSSVSFQLQSGEILALVGESGCGKSTLANSIMKLLPPNARISQGSIALEGEDLLTKREAEWQSIRGSQLAMIFQDPMTALDPLFTVGDQLIETVQEHMGLDKTAARQRALELFRQVGISAAEERLNAYPHQFSGGMRQRISLAIAISCHPRVLIADEPTTGLDVSIQAQILSLLKRLLVQERGAGVLLITHDLGIVAQVCDRVAVMYAGDIVEVGDVVSVLTNPLHPYTQALLNSLPTRQTARGQLANIPGNVPALANRPAGCRFQPRCAFAKERCTHRFPDRIQMTPEQAVACVLYDAQ